MFVFLATSTPQNLIGQYKLIQHSVIPRFRLKMETIIVISSKHEFTKIYATENRMLDVSHSGELNFSFSSFPNNKMYEKVINSV